MAHSMNKGLLQQPLTIETFHPCCPRTAQHSYCGSIVVQIPERNSLEHVNTISSPKPSQQLHTAMQSPKQELEDTHPEAVAFSILLQLVSV